jgi:hypothetical protein
MFYPVCQKQSEKQFWAAGRRVCSTVNYWIQLMVSRDLCLTTSSAPLALPSNIFKNTFAPLELPSHIFSFVTAELQHSRTIFFLWYFQKKELAEIALVHLFCLLSANFPNNLQTPVLPTDVWRCCAKHFISSTLCTVTVHTYHVLLLNRNHKLCSSKKYFLVFWCKN